MRRCGKGECVIDFFSTPELDEMPDTAVSLHCLQERGMNLTRCCSFPLLLCGQLCCTEDEGGGGEGGKRKGENLSLNYTRGPSVGIQRKRGTQE